MNIFDKMINIVNDIAQDCAVENYINDVNYKEEEIIEMCINNLNKLKNDISAK